MVSVIICTWNRACLLDQTLRQMRELYVSAELNWELLVVNNNCTDMTDEVLERHKEHLPLRRLFEPAPGKAHALNLAVREASGEFLIFTDDDVLVDRNWLHEYVKAARKWPAASFFGGPIEPWFASTPPSWIRRNIGVFAHAFGTRQLAEEVQQINRSRHLPYGANMALRKSCLPESAYDTRLGPTAGEKLGGEEIDLLRRLLNEGHVGVWVESAKVRHFVPVESMTSNHLATCFRSVGRHEARDLDASGVQFMFGLPRFALRQYWESRIKCWLFSPFKGRKWASSFRDLMRARGLLEGWRDRSRAVKPR